MNRWKKNRAPFYTSKPSNWTFYFEIKKFMLKWTFAQFKRSYGQKDNWHMAFQTNFKSSCDSTKICCPQPNIICSLKAVPNHHCLNHQEKKITAILLLERNTFADRCSAREHWFRKPCTWLYIVSLHMCDGLLSC